MGPRAGLIQLGTATAGQRTIKERQVILAWVQGFGPETLCQSINRAINSKNQKPQIKQISNYSDIAGTRPIIIKKVTKVKEKKYFYKNQCISINCMVKGMGK